MHEMLCRIAGSKSSLLSIAQTPRMKHKEVSSWNAQALYLGSLSKDQQIVWRALSN